MALLREAMGKLKIPLIVTVRDYRRLESGGDSVLRGEVFDRMCEVFGRPVSGRPG